MFGEKHLKKNHVFVGDNGKVWHSTVVNSWFGFQRHKVVYLGNLYTLGVFENEEKLKIIKRLAESLDCTYYVRHSY